MRNLLANAVKFTPRVHIACCAWMAKPRSLRRPQVQERRRVCSRPRSPPCCHGERHMKGCIEMDLASRAQPVVDALRSSDRSVVTAAESCRAGIVGGRPVARRSRPGMSSWRICRIHKGTEASGARCRASGDAASWRRERRDREATDGRRVASLACNQPARSPFRPYLGARARAIPESAQLSGARH